MALAKYRDPSTGEWKYVDIPPHHHDSRYPDFTYVDDADAADRAYTDTETAKRLRWTGPHTIDGKQYYTNDVTRDGEWLMVAVADTTDIPAPQTSGDLDDLLLPWVPTRGSVRATVYMANRWTIADAGWIGYIGMVIEKENLGFTHTGSLQVNGVQVWAIAFKPKAEGTHRLNITPYIVVPGDVVEVAVQVTPPGNENVYWSEQAGLFATPPLHTSLAEGSNDDRVSWTDTAYGIHLSFQPGTKSPDWEILSYMGTASGGGGTGTGGGDSHYIHTQEAVAATWTIAHNLGKRPAVDVLDGGGAVVYGEIEHTDQDNLVMRFTWPITGTAICN